VPYSALLHIDHIKKARPAKSNVAAFKPTEAADPVCDANEGEEASDELLDIDADVLVVLDLAVAVIEEPELDPELDPEMPLALALV